MTFQVNLTGPPPWGFRICGGRDFKMTLTVSKVSWAYLAHFFLGTKYWKYSAWDAFDLWCVRELWGLAVCFDRFVKVAVQVMLGCKWGTLFWRLMVRILEPCWIWRLGTKSRHLNISCGYLLKGGKIIKSFFLQNYKWFHQRRGI